MPKYCLEYKIRQGRFLGQYLNRIPILRTIFFSSRTWRWKQVKPSNCLVVNKLTCPFKTPIRKEAVIELLFWRGYLRMQQTKKGVCLTGLATFPRRNFLPVVPVTSNAISSSGQRWLWRLRIASYCDVSGWLRNKGRFHATARHSSTGKLTSFVLQRQLTRTTTQIVLVQVT